MLKVLKFISGLILFYALIQGYGYINLMVSEKFETDDTLITLSDMSEKRKEKELEIMKNRYQEIQVEKRYMIRRGVISLALFLVLCIIWVTKKKKLNPLI